jgi:hypothetical protein
MNDGPVTPSGRPAAEKETSSPGRGDASPRPAANDGGAEASAPADVSKTAKARPARVPLQTLEQMIDLAYDRKGQRISLTPKVRAQLAQVPKLDDAARSRLLDRARADLMLGVPRQLLAIANDLDRYGRLREELLAFIGAALRAHPVFASEELFTRQSPIEGEPAHALAAVARLDLATIGQLAQAGIRKKAQLVELRRNALYSLAAWFLQRRDTPVEDLVAILFAHLWSREADGLKNPGKRLQRILELRDPAALGVACGKFAELAREQSRVAESSRKAAAESLQKLEALSTKCDGLQRDLHDQKEELSLFKEAQVREQQQHSDAVVHLRNEFERLRTRALRNLRNEIVLLEEGLHAARLSPPKLHVTLDHAERAIEGLKQEAKRLETES